MCHPPQARNGTGRGGFYRYHPPPIHDSSVDPFDAQVIAVSTPHRREAFEACEFILEEVKRKAQIWKREYYEGEDENTAEWKANH